MNKINKKFSGVAAVEFGLIFPLLFLMLYGILTYSLIFTVQHTLSFAAAEAARSALRFQSLNDDTIESRKDAACIDAEKNLEWLKAMTGDISCANFVKVEDFQCGQVDPNNFCVKVRIEYPYRNKPVIPQIGFPIPPTIVGESFAKISLSF